MRQALVQRDGITGDVSRSGRGSFFFFLSFYFLIYTYLSLVSLVELFSGNVGECFGEGGFVVLWTVFFF